MLRLSRSARRFSTVTRYTKDHEWLRYTEPNDDKIPLVKLGITDHAQCQLGDVVFVDCQVKIGKEIGVGDTLAAVESVKAASDVYSPAKGVVTDFNQALEDDPGLINTDPEGDGWFVEFDPSDFKELNKLMSEEEYKEFCKKEEKD